MAQSRVEIHLAAPPVTVPLSTSYVAGKTPADSLYDARFQIISMNWLHTVEFTVAAV